MGESRYLLAIGGWLGIASGLHWLWQTADLQPSGFWWAVTTATMIIIFVVVMWSCEDSQKIWKDRLESCSKAKAKLQHTILQNRRSSNG